jgi:hypothetical protein
MLQVTKVCSFYCFTVSMYTFAIICLLMDYGLVDLLCNESMDYYALNCGG